MRFLGVLVIIYAHTHPPEWIDQLRNFGTPLLIVASAATYAYIYRNNRSIDVPSFLRKRIYRLLVPLWLFLTFFFGSMAVLAFVIDRPYPFDPQIILESYALHHGIGFVWIFKVYLYLAFLTPPLLAFCRNVRSDLTFYSILLATFVFYTILCYYYERTMSEEAYGIFSEYVLTIIPYAVLYCYGLRLSTLKRRTVILVALGSGLVCGAIAVYLYLDTGHWVLTQEHKYPPQLYYLSYAFLWVNLIYVAAYSRIVKSIPPTVMHWLSDNSLWIYLWHIMAVYVWERVIDYDGTFVTSLVKFWLLLLTSMALVAVQNEVTRRVPVLRKVLDGNWKMKKVA